MHAGKLAVWTCVTAIRCVRTVCNVHKTSWFISLSPDIFSYVTVSQLFYYFLLDFKRSAVGWAER